jgi:hypothetical protein
VGVCESAIQVAAKDTGVTSGTQASAKASVYTVDKTDAQNPAYQEASRVVVETEVSSGKVESTYSINTLYTETAGQTNTQVLNTAGLFRSTGLYVRSGKGDNTSTASTISLEYDGISMSNTDSAIYIGGDSNFRIRFAANYPTSGKNSLLFEAYNSTSATWVVQSSMERATS